MQCPTCGIEVVREAVYCHRCGRRLDEEPNGAAAEVFSDAAAARRPTTDRPPSENRAAEAFFDAMAARRGSDEPPEVEIWRGGYSPKAMTGMWGLSSVVSLAVLAGGIYWAHGAVAWLIVLGLAVLPWLYHVGLLGYRMLSARYVLTTRRFIHESGLLRRVNDRVEVLDMDDIAFEQGPLERLLGIGTLRIASSDRSHPQLVLRGIDNVKSVASEFDNARLAERRRHGVHMEQI